MKKILLFVLIVLCISCFATGLVACGSGNGEGEGGGELKESVVVEGITYTYDKDADGYVVTSAELESSIITIPSQVEGKDVVAIGAEAFRSDKLLKEITLPSTVKEIGYAAFRATTKLQKINLENVEVIASDAFRESFSTNNTNIKMSSLKTLETMAFYSCAKLREVDMTGAPLNAIPESCFESCALLYKVILSSSTKTIWKRAFAGDSCIVQINLDYVEYLKDNCFENCKNLTSLYMPNIIDIRHEAFYECNKITTVTLGNKVERIYVRAFFQLPISSFVIGNAMDFEYYYFESANVTSNGAFNHSLPTTVIKEIDKTNPADWAVLITGHYNKGYFICTQKWMDDNGYKAGDRPAHSLIFNQP